MRVWKLPARGVTAAPRCPKEGGRHDASAGVNNPAGKASMSAYRRQAQAGSGVYVHDTSHCCRHGTINVYRPTVHVMASQASAYRDVPFSPSHPKMFSSWHVFGPRRCTGPRGSYICSGRRRKFTPPRTGARRATSWPTTETSTTPTASCLSGTIWRSAIGRRQRRARQELLPVEHDGQLRAVRGVWQPIRGGLRGLPDAEA